MNHEESRRQFLGQAARLGLSAASMALLGGCAGNPGQGPGGAPAPRVATIGYLRGNLGGDASNFNDLRQGLRELEWVEGEHVRFEIRFPQSDSAAHPELAAELVRLPVDVIVTQGTPSAVAAAAATRTLPIVMVGGPADVVERGLAASIQRPGGNLTGNAQAPSEIFGKRLEQLVEAVPHVARVAFIGEGGPAIGASLGETARTLGVQLQVLTPQSERELELAFEAIGREAADAMLVDGYEITNSHQAWIADFAAQRRLPAMYETRLNAGAGGLMSYDVNRAALHRHAAAYVDRILRGAKPGDLPIEYPTRYELLINLRAAAALGLTIPDALLAQASEVIR